MLTECDEKKFFYHLWKKENKNQEDDIAKKYDGNDTGSFVNGILGSFARSLTPVKAEEET